MLGRIVTDMNTAIALTKVRGLAQSGAARAIREGAGLSLREVAEVVGVDRTTIFRWEIGTRRPQGHKAITYGQLLDDIMARDQ